MNTIIRTCTLLPALLLAACSTGAPGDTAAQRAETAGGEHHEIVMYRDPRCGCCGNWVDYMRGEGFEVTVHEERHLNARRSQLGVPDALASCHTAVVDGYLLEGHVPAGAVHRLLAERPEGLGLSVPGMPIGSPGMEVEARDDDEYAVVLFDAGGNASEFARYHGHRLLSNQ